MNLTDNDRIYFRLPTVTFERPLTLGSCRFVDHNTMTNELNITYFGEPAAGSSSDGLEATRQSLAQWGTDAALSVPFTTWATPVAGERFSEKVSRETADWARADQIAAEATAVLRFAARRHLPWNHENYRFGRSGDHASGFRDHIVLNNRGLPMAAPGWHRVGGWPDITFDDATIYAIESDPAFAWLGKLVGGDPTSRTEGERRALRAVTLIDRGFRTQDADLRILLAGVAVEVSFSRHDIPAHESQIMAIARRIAFLTCEGGCGLQKPPCTYTERAKTRKQLRDDVTKLLDAEDFWECSAFLRIAAPPEIVPLLPQPPLFSARNAIAHEGGSNLNERTAISLVREAETAVWSALTWLARHPGASMIDLDAEIDGVA